MFIQTQVILILAHTTYFPPSTASNIPDVNASEGSEQVLEKLSTGLENIKKTVEKI